MAVLRVCKLLLAVALPDLRQEIAVKEGVDIVLGTPAPFLACKRVVHILWPRVDNALAARVRLEGDLRIGEGFEGAVAELPGGHGEGSDVVDHVGELLTRN